MPAPAPPPAKEVIGSEKHATSAENQLSPILTLPPAPSNLPRTTTMMTWSLTTTLILAFLNLTIVLTLKMPLSLNVLLLLAVLQYQAAHQQLRHMNIAIKIKADDEDLCCANSGATRHMFPDYKTFVRYQISQMSQ